MKAIVEMVFMLTVITMFIILIIMHWIRVIEHVHIYIYSGIYVNSDNNNVYNINNHALS